MIISRKKFEQELEKARAEVYERENHDRDMRSIWQAIYRLEEKVDKLEGKNGETLVAVNRPVRGYAE